MLHVETHMIMLLKNPDESHDTLKVHQINSISKKNKLNENRASPMFLLLASYCLSTCQGGWGVKTSSSILRSLPLMVHNNNRAGVLRTLDTMAFRKVMSENKMTGGGWHGKINRKCGDACRWQGTSNIGSPMTTRDDTNDR